MEINHHLGIFINVGTTLPLDQPDVFLLSTCSANGEVLPQFHQVGIESGAFVVSQ